MSTTADYLTTPGMAFRAAEAGQRDFVRGPSADRRMTILKELTEIEGISQRLRGETIEQYGTIAASRERNKEARAVAAMEANGNIESARLNASPRQQVALIQQELDVLVAKVEGNAEVLDNRLGKIDADRAEGFVKDRTKLYAAGKSSDELVQGYLQGDVNNTLVKNINNTISVLTEPIDKVVFAEGALQKMSDTVDRDVATMNAVLRTGIYKDAKFATPEARSEEYNKRKITEEQRNAIIGTLKGQLSVKDETAAQAKVEVAAARKRMDELREDKTYANFLAIPDVANPSDMDDIGKMFANIDDPQALKDQRQRLEDELQTTLTPLGQVHKMLMNNNGKFLSDLYGFSDTVDAAAYFLENPQALQQALQVDQNQSTEEARAELGANLGIERYSGASPNVARLRVRAVMMGAPTAPEDYREGFEPEPGVPGAAPLELDEDIEGETADLKRARAARDKLPPGSDVDEILKEPTARQVAVDVGAEQAAKIKTPVTADARALLKQGTSGDQQAKVSLENQEIYDNLPAGAIKEAFGVSVGIPPTSSFNVARADGPPKTQSSFNVSTAKTFPKFVPPNIKDTPEYKADMKRRQESFREGEQAQAEFNALPKDVQDKLVSLSLSNDPKYSGNATPAGRMDLLKTLGGVERVASLEPYLFQKNQNQARAMEYKARSREQKQARDDRINKAKEEKAAEQKRDNPDSGSPGRTLLPYSPTGSSTDTFVPVKDNRPNDLANKFGAPE